MIILEPPKTLSIFDFLIPVFARDFTTKTSLHIICLIFKLHYCYNVWVLFLFYLFFFIRVTPPSCIFLARHHQRRSSVTRPTDVVIFHRVGRLVINPPPNPWHGWIVGEAAAVTPARDRHRRRRAQLVKRKAAACTTRMTRLVRARWNYCQTHPHSAVVIRELYNYKHNIYVCI